MNRRDVIRTFLGLGGVAAVQTPVASATPSWPTVDQPMLYKGYRLHWTGWKGAQDWSWLAGQWLAWPLNPNDPYLYVSLPGMRGGYYHLGHVYDLSSNNRPLVTIYTPESERQVVVAEGQQEIQKLVDQVRNPKAPVEPPFKFGFTRFEPTGGGRVGVALESIRKDRYGVIRVGS